MYVFIYLLYESYAQYSKQEKNALIFISNLVTILSNNILNE